MKQLLRDNFNYDPTGVDQESCLRWFHYNYLLLYSIYDLNVSLTVTSFNRVYVLSVPRCPLRHKVPRCPFYSRDYKWSLQTQSVSAFLLYGQYLLRLNAGFTWIIISGSFESLSIVWIHGINPSNTVWFWCHLHRQISQDSSYRRADLFLVYRGLKTLAKSLIASSWLSESEEQISQNNRIAFQSRNFYRKRFFLFQSKVNTVE